MGCPALQITDQSHYLYQLYRLLWAGATPTLAERAHLSSRLLMAFQYLDRAEPSIRAQAAQQKGDHGENAT